MQILALETSNQPGSIALAQFSGSPDNRIVMSDELELENGAKTSSTLVPAIKHLLSRNQCRLDQTDLIVVSEGPGSFTGLRIGITTAKTLSYALGSEVAGINTLELLAWIYCFQNSNQIEQIACQTIIPIINAQRKELFFQYYRVSEKQPKQVISTNKPAIVSQDDLGKLICAESIVVAAESKLINSIHLAEGSIGQVQYSAIALAQMANAKRSQLGNSMDKRKTAFELNPRYYRKSAAEEKK